MVKLKLIHVKNGPQIHGKTYGVSLREVPLMLENFIFKLPVTFPKGGKFKHFLSECKVHKQLCYWEWKSEMSLQWNLSITTT